MDVYAKLIRAGVIVLGLVILYFMGRELVSKVIDFVQAPVQAELDASRGNQAAGKAASDHQTSAVDGLAKAGDEKKAASKAAVNAAGGVQFKRAAEIQQAPAVGVTDYERAVNRIDRELSLR